MKERLNSSPKQIKNNEAEIDEIIIKLAKTSEENFQNIKEELEKAQSNKGGMNAKQI